MGNFYEIGFLQDGKAVEVQPAEERRRQGVVRGSNSAGLFLARVREYTPNGWSHQKDAIEEFLPWTSVALVSCLAHDAIPADRRADFVAAGYVAPDGQP